MRRLAFIAALLLPCAALAWGPTIRSGGGRMVRGTGQPGPLVSIPANVCGAGAPADVGPAFGTSRSGTAAYLCGGWQSAATGQVRVEDGNEGALNEPATTQYLLNNCASPTTQTVTLTAAAHTGWLEGAGSMVLEAGTAVATGLPCTATAASSCHFTVTTGGTVTATISGYVPAAQLEKSAFATSRVCCTSAACSRTGDHFQSLTYPIPSDAMDFCVSIDAKPLHDRGWGSTAYLFASSGVGGANSYFLSESIWRIYGASGSKQIAYSLAGTGWKSIEACVLGGALSLRVDGIAAGTASGTGAAMSAHPTGFFWGNNSGATSTFPGHLKNMRICRGGIPGRCPRAAGSDWPATISVAPGYLSTTIRGSTAWSITGLSHGGVQLGVDAAGTYWGTVAIFPGDIYIGSGHTYGTEAEIVTSRALAVGGVDQFAPRSYYGGETVTLSKSSSIRTIGLTNTLEIASGSLTETTVVRATEATTVKRIYHSLLPWMPSGTAWLAKRLVDDVEISGTFDGDGSMDVAVPVRWSAVWHESLGKGTVSCVTAPGSSWKVWLWDANTTYRKHYLVAFDNNGTIPADTDLTYSVTTLPFDATAETWQAQARATAGGCP